MKASSPGAGNPADIAACPYQSYRHAALELKAMGRNWAAPSFVAPGTVADNCRLLAGLVPEVGLVLFETEACLRYDERDLPPSLAELPLAYHLHLPLDLPWADGPQAAWDAVRRLVDKTAYLSPRAYVLHPPATVAELAAFTALWTAHGLAAADLLLENVEDNDLAALLAPSAEMGLSLCLDLGHLMAYNQHVPALERDLARVRMLHIYAPGPGARHRPLAELDAAGKAVLAQLLTLAPSATVMLEVFDATGLFDSARLLATWMKEWNAAL